MLPLNEKMKSLREEKGLSQEEVAIKLNVVRQTVSKWEKGLSVPDAEMFTRLAVVFDTTVGTLMGEEPVKPSKELSAQESVCIPSHKRRLTVLSIVLLIVGSPIWLALGVSATVVVLALYVSWWAVIVLLWASFVAFIGGAVGGVVSGFGMICSGELLSGGALIGMSLIVAGLGIFLFFGCKSLTKCAVMFTKRMFLRIKNRISQKEDAE